MKGLGSKKNCGAESMCGGRGGGGGEKYKDKRFDFITGVDKVDWPP